MTRGLWLSALLLGLMVACSPQATGVPTGSPPTSAATAALPAATPAAVAAATAAAGPMTVVHTGYVPVLISAPYYIAVEKGYFKDVGIDLQLEPLQGGSDAVIQLASGNFDVAAGGAGVGFWNAVDRGVKFIVVSPLHTETAHQATPLVTSKTNFDSGKVKSAADLKGK